MTINPKAEKTINEIYSKVNIEDYNIKISDKKTLNEKYLKNIFGEADNNTIYVRPGIYAMSTRKIESLIALAEIQRYYQANPVRFIDDWFNIELLDAQAYIVQRAWVCPNVLLVCSRGFGKSTITDIIIMAKDMLFSNYWSYIASGSGSQAEQTFTTLEKLANDNIDSMMGSTGYIFKDEVEVKNAAGDGFSHSSDGFSYSLYNGSMTKTLNSSTIDAYIFDKNADGTWLVVVNKAEERTALIYQKPLIDYESPRALTQISNFYNDPKDGPVRGYVLHSLDRFSLSDEGFSGTPKKGGKITTITDGKLVVAE